MGGDFKYKTCVGVPVFNEEAYIEDTIRSLKAQDLDARFLISDNASTDRTPEIITDLITGDSRFELVRQPRNIGSWLNFQYVLDNSLSKYFMWLGAHDLLSENFLRPLVAILDERPDVALAAPMPWKLTDGRAPVPTPEGVYEFSDSEPVHRFLKFVAEISNCTVFHSLVRRQHLENYTLPQTLACDRVFLSHMIWHGKLAYHAEPRYIRRYFSARSESSEERLRGDGELPLASTHAGYLEVFARLAEPVLSDVAYKRHVRTITKLVHGSRSLAFETKYGRTRKILASTQKKLAEALTKSQAEGDADAVVKAEAKANRYKKRLIQARVELRRVERELAETKRMLDMTLASRLVAAYRSFRAKRKLHPPTGSKSQAATSPPQ